VTDNLFDRLADLFRASGPVNWRLAREIAESVAGPADPIDPWTDDQLRDLAATAQRLITAGTPLDALAGAEGLRILDRRQWATANVEGLSYLAEPIAERLSAMGGALGPELQPLGPALLGMQVGALVGLSSHRVLGQFDMVMTAGEPAPLTFIPENIAGLAMEHGLDPAQVQMWAALREVAFSAEMSVPWTREHLLMLGHAHAEDFEPDHESIDEIQRLLQDPDAMRGLMDGEGGFDALQVPFTSGETARSLGAFVEFIEGYGDHIVERAGAPFLPDLSNIRVAAAQRRSQGAEGERAMYRALGLDPDPDTPAIGAAFCDDVARRWGEESLDRVWEGPEMLPTAEELTDPTGWAARVLL
jgi:putative hydrolase